MNIPDTLSLDYKYHSSLKGNRASIFRNLFQRKNWTGMQKCMPKNIHCNIMLDTGHSTYVHLCGYGTYKQWNLSESFKRMIWIYVHQHGRFPVYIVAEIRSSIYSMNLIYIKLYVYVYLYRDKWNVHTHTRTKWLLPERWDLGFDSLSLVKK